MDQVIIKAQIKKVNFKGRLLNFMALERTNYWINYIFQCEVTFQMNAPLSRYIVNRNYMIVEKDLRIQKDEIHMIKEDSLNQEKMVEPNSIMIDCQAYINESDIKNTKETRYYIIYSGLDCLI